MGINLGDLVLEPDSLAFTDWLSWEYFRDARISRALFVTSSLNLTISSNFSSSSGSGDKSMELQLENHQGSIVHGLILCLTARHRNHLATSFLMLLNDYCPATLFGAAFGQDTTCADASDESS